MKTYKQFIIESNEYSPKDELLELEKLPNVKITHLQKVPLSGFIGKISIDGNEYNFDADYDLGDWEYFIYDVPGSGHGSGSHFEDNGIEGNIEDLVIDLKEYLGVK